MDKLVLKENKKLNKDSRYSGKRKSLEYRPGDSCNTTSSSNSKFISTALKISHYFASSHIKNIYHNPLGKKSTLVPVPWKSKLTTMQGAEKKKTNISITRIAWFMAAVGYQIFLTRGKINEFNLQMISPEWRLLNRKTEFHVKLKERNTKTDLRMSITHKLIKSTCTTPNCNTLPMNSCQVCPKGGPLHKTLSPVLYR